MIVFSTYNLKKRRPETRALKLIAIKLQLFILSLFSCCYSSLLILIKKIDVLIKLLKSLGFVYIQNRSHAIKSTLNYVLQIKHTFKAKHNYVFQIKHAFNAIHNYVLQKMHAFKATYIHVLQIMHAIKAKHNYLLLSKHQMHIIYGFINGWHIHIDRLLVEINCKASIKRYFQKHIKRKLKLMISKPTMVNPVVYQ